MQRLESIIDREQEKLKKQNKVLNDLSRFVNEGQKLLNSSRKLLDEDDPVYAKIEELIYASKKTHSEVNFFIKNSAKIVDF